ncbi:hypothetical protein [Effusibacillus consociatus]|uniref:Uncharacterized protein n=1 Tax=Effusibacillus consociatus TaxID=1117041 RepID=A0ABV9Q3M8_9BACL
MADDKDLNGQFACSREETDRLKAKMEGLHAELEGHSRDDAHTRARLGKSFGRPEGEILEEVDQVQQQLINCNR